ncbi:MAG: hypothetical protein ACKO1U_01060 [Bacteroidota bacterium]
MKKGRFGVIVAAMSAALAGIILLQAYWIRHDFRLKEQQFEQSVNQAMLAVVNRLETSEAADMLHQKVFSLFPDSLSDLSTFQRSGDSLLSLKKNSTGSTTGESETADRSSSVGQAKEIGIESPMSVGNNSYISVRKRNVIREDSTSRQTIRAAQITRVFGDSAEVILRLDEEKVKARLSKLN